MPKRTTSITLSDRLGRPSILSGALVGLMLMASLIAVSYLAWRHAPLPFVAVDFFDSLARAVQGATAASGIIDRIASVLSAFDPGQTAETSRIVGRTAAIGGLLLAGAISGALLFALLRAFRGNYASISGVLVGTAIGAPLAFFNYGAAQPAPAGSTVGALWILGAFPIWGVILGRSYRRLNSGGATEAARIGRRRFLIRMACATAAIAVAGAVAG